MTYPIKYGISNTVYFNLKDGSNDLFPGATFEVGDLKLSVDGGVYADTTNLPTEIGNGVYSLVLTVGESTGEQINLSIIDQTLTKAFVDQIVILQTVGNTTSAYINDISTLDIFNEATEGSETFIELLRLMRAVMLGKSSNNGTTFRDLGDTKDRVVSIVDANKNRTNITTDPTV